MATKPSPAHKNHTQKKKSISVPTSSTHHSIDQYDDISHLFISTTGSVATILHMGTDSSVTETIQPMQVVTKSKSIFLQKYQMLLNDGAINLKIVSDFDFTLTKFYIFKPLDKTKDASILSTHPHLNPVTEQRRSSVSSHVLSHVTETTTSTSTLLQRGITCHSILEDCHLFSKEYQDQSVAIFHKYYPLEMDPHIAYEKKYQYMMEWTKEIHNLLLKIHLTRNHIEQAVKEAVDERRIEIRSNVETFFQVSTQLDIPFLLFSGGLADVSEKVLENSFQDKSLLNKIIFLANRCKFDENGKVIGFQEPLVHALNKKASTFLTSVGFFRSEIEVERRSVILIGDSARDILMVSGMKYDADKSLKIGFLNDKVPERFDSYLDIYDIVIIGNEAGFDIPLELLQNICRVDGNTLFENSVLQEELRQQQSGATTVGYEKAFAYDAETGYDVTEGFEIDGDDLGYGAYDSYGD